MRNAEAQLAILCQRNPSHTGFSMRNRCANATKPIWDWELVIPFGILSCCYLVCPPQVARRHPAVSLAISGSVPEPQIGLAGFILCFPSIRNESFFLQVHKTTRFLEKDFFFFAWKTLLVEKTARLEKWPAVNLRDTFFPAHYELKHSDQADNNGPSSQIKEILYKKFSRVEFV